MIKTSSAKFQIGQVVWHDLGETDTHRPSFVGLGFCRLDLGLARCAGCHVANRL